ncbi:GNAT family N-acetyltransferase [Massilia antarctica]|uniref:GNAT family N-acetyltransferase n=1 Tax=Massilia antarctica TaxID=2765360 RepID=UPI0006BB8B65|nr:GNAT family N-acetyltransferase [Massilia sp. H27-R4]MCY0915809.1 GNAT family N-acetyltransferase [Massilia sp. H27-R4]CUI06146.1 Histone acetyltransferase HPA2 and related acetyltransferases [Janthinobacterium sp. CG23_2]CUU29932.1 Histone acetyltransferase HPA2 and related acetyltransferases [Janthinobacterium sp. CG23_2]
MIAIAACDPDSLDARILIEELSAALAAITGDSGKASFSADDARLARSLFVVARDQAGQALGCAALRPLDGDVGEVKRMFARPGTNGVGAALLAHVEQAAQGFGYRQLWLETRKVNTRAVGFYEKHGYATIPGYGKYVGRDEAVCLGKLLRDE